MLNKNKSNLQIGIHQSYLLIKLTFGIFNINSYLLTKLTYLKDLSVKSHISDITQIILIYFVSDLIMLLSIYRVIAIFSCSYLKSLVTILNSISITSCLDCTSLLMQYKGKLQRGLR